MKQYNRALDLLAAAAVFASEGKPNHAAKAFTAAVKCSSLQAALKIIEASNKKAFTASKAVKASDDVPADNVGEEFREEPSENGDRVVQEASAKSLRARAARLLQRADAMDAEDGDDADLSFLDDQSVEADADGDLDDLDDMDDGEDFTANASFIKAFGARSSAKPAAKPTPVSAGAFARAVHNLNAVKK